MYHTVTTQHYTTQHKHSLTIPKKEIIVHIFFGSKTPNNLLCLTTTPSEGITTTFFLVEYKKENNQAPPPNLLLSHSLPFSVFFLSNQSHNWCLHRQRKKLRTFNDSKELLLYYHNHCFNHNNDNRLIVVTLLLLRNTNNNTYTKKCLNLVWFGELSIWKKKNRKW